MKRTKLLKTFLVAATLCVGMSAWAYDVPEGYEIKNVFIGTLNGEGTTVTAEDFSTATGVPSGWTYDVNSLTIAEITEVEKSNIGVEISNNPTYVAGNTLKAYLRQGTGDGNQWRYATYTFDEISTGKLVFSADFFADGNVTNSAMYLQFLDANDNLILTLAPYAYSNTQGNYGYAVGTDALQSIGTSNSFWRNYVGYGIKDLVFDFTTGETTLILDFTERSSGTWHRAQKSFTINIGTGKAISKFRIGKKTLSSNDINFYIDNIELFTVGAQAGSYDYTIKATANGGQTELATIASGKSKGGMTYGATGLSKVIESNGIFYVLDDTNVSNYSVSYTMGDADENRTVNYTADGSIVYFREGETLVQNNASSTCSGGAYCGYYAGPLTIDISAAGTYQLETNVTGRQERSSLCVYPEGGIDVLASIAQNGGNGERTSGSFVAAANSKVRIGGPYYNNKFQNSLSFDYIILRKISDDANMSITIGSTGFATYSNANYALDFTGLAVKAYTASLTDANTVLLSPVNQVPAGEGVLLKGTQGDYEVPVIASADALVGNLLKASKDEVIAASTDDLYHYVLANGANGVGFYNVARPRNIGAGKAYLETTTALADQSTTARVAWTFADEDITGISDVNRETVSSDRIYNVNGQAVMAPQKGLYIMNGKKVLVK